MATVIGRHAYTPEMQRANALCQHRFQKSLRQYLLLWRRSNPHSSLSELAEFFSINRATLDNWLDRLHLASGKTFIDLDREVALRAVAKTEPTAAAGGS